MGIFTKKSIGDKVKEDFFNEKELALQENQNDNPFLSFSSNQPQDNKNSFISFSNNTIENSLATNISPAIYDLIHKLELAVRSGKIDSESVELFNQVTKLCSTDQISKISPVITAPTLQLFVEKSKELGRETSVIENNMGQNQDQNLAKNPANNPSDYMSDFREFMKERQNPMQAQQELISEASLEKDNSKKI